MYRYIIQFTDRHYKLQFNVQCFCASVSLNIIENSELKARRPNN